MTKTQNYQLNQWDAADPIRREDFNADNAALDAALNAIKNAAEEDVAALNETVATVAAGLGSGGSTCRIAWGSYTGNGKYGSGNPNSLTFDFTPAVVIIGCYETAYNASWPTVAIRGAAASHGDTCPGNERMYITWADHGLSWYSDNHQSYQNNYSGFVYYYVALGYNAE